MFWLDAITLIDSFGSVAYELGEWSCYSQNALSEEIGAKDERTFILGEAPVCSYGALLSTSSGVFILLKYNKNQL